MENKENNLAFIKEVAKYFMNFLETDFHKTRLPKRNSISKIVKWYKVWLDLEKYKKLKKDFYTIFYGGFSKNTLSIKKGTYTSSISDNIFKLIKSKVKNLDEELLNITFFEIEKNLKEIKKTHIKNYQLYLETSKDTIQTIFSRNFILPFLDSIEAPLKTLELVDENWLYQIEWELSDSLYSVFESIIIDILQSFFEYDENIKILTLDIDKKSKENNKVKSFNIIKELKNNILLDELKANIELFFKNISIADAFDDIYILFKNNKLIDKTELYLYMYEISTGKQGKHTFPLFYLPIKLEEKKWSFELTFDQRLYVNTKAIDYVVQEYNRWNTSSMWTLAWNFDRIIYINDDENFIEKVKWISNSIQNFFKFNKWLDWEDSKYQKLENLLTWFSNKSYIYLFDKSDESVVNDYEEILNDEEWILGQFSVLLNDFIEHNPKNFEEEIEDKWSNKSVSNKLIFESPIPLNDEQKQVIIALQNPDCKVVTLEWPPWTWKSHTITAIICRALLDSKSVLVLSDKKEALDVIEDKITETLNKVRKDDDFLNPILRLWKSWNKFWKIVQWQTINKIAEHYSAYKHKKSDLDKEKNNLLSIIWENIDNNISHYENISIKDIKYFFNNVDKYSKINWITDEDIEKIKIYIKLIKDTLVNIEDLKGFDVNLFDLSKDTISIINKSNDILLKISEIKKNNNLFPNRNKSIYVFWSKEKILDKIDSYVVKINEELKDFYNFEHIQEFKILKFNNYYEISKYIKILLNKYKDFKELGKYNIISELDVNINYKDFNNSVTEFLSKNSKIKEENNIELKNIEWKYEKYYNLNEKLSNFVWENLEFLRLLDNFKLLDYSKSKDSNKNLIGYIEEINNLKSSIIWYLFKKKKIKEVNVKIKSDFYSYDIDDTHKKIDDIIKINNLFNFIFQLLEDDVFNEFDFEFIINFIADYNLKKDLVVQHKNNEIEKIKNTLNINKNDNYLKIKDYFYKNISEEIESSWIDELENINNILFYIDTLWENIDKIKFLEYFKKYLVIEDVELNSKLISLYDSVEWIINNINLYEKSLFDFEIKELKTIFNYIELNSEIKKYLEISSNKYFSFDKVLNSKESIINNNLSDYIKEYKENFDKINKLFQIKESLDTLNNFQSEFPNFSKNIEFDIKSSSITKLSSIINNFEDEFIENYLEFKKIELSLTNNFLNTPDDIFSDWIQNIQEQTTAEMAYFLDKRIVEYTRNYANEVNTLKWIISKKKKFPKGLFKNLKNAFPCILAGIRDYSDYIPLEKDLFDLIIIDEASQVSIAQSLPALIRWKKIIILWDDKQFSNVKSNNASKIVNQEYKTSVKKTFIEERLAWKEDEFGWLENVWNFDIKYSILKFSQSVQNYKCQLKKHFRWYPEIISYSNKHFYNGSLQCMKIRGKPIEEVIKIKVIEHDWLIDTAKNTNELEINYIIKKILEFKEKGIVQSLWIITPHQHQAWLLMDRIDELPDKDWIKNKCKLKIMTFDSCQWEERDYIFYSMVATEEKDRLRYIFIKDLASVNDEENWSVRAQRLNVWFSRAKECMHFVLSKPINDFTWEIKNALLHYNNELEAGKKVKLWWTDINSPMEKKIQEYFYETRFYKDNTDMIEFIPQFDIWKYLKQLDKTYNHPAYKVDFLLIYKKQKIVIEYDWFKEHFENIESVDKYNYESYMKADDIYRQKVLEWYGYKFLRINKFNIWENPVETLDLRLNELFKKKTLANEWLNNLYEQIDKLHDWDDRVCTSCNEIFKSQYFPYKTKTQCVNCYEKENWKTLWTFRQRLKDYEREIGINSPKIEKKDFTNYSNKTEQCPYCYSGNIQWKGYRNNKKRLLCGNCWKNWSVPISIAQTTINTSIQNNDTEEEFNEFWFNEFWYNEEWFNRLGFDNHWYDINWFNSEWYHCSTQTKYNTDWFTREQIW